MSDKENLNLKIFFIQETQDRVENIVSIFKKNGYNVYYKSSDVEQVIVKEILSDEYDLIIYDWNNKYWPILDKNNSIIENENSPHKILNYYIKEKKSIFSVIFYEFNEKSFELAINSGIKNILIKTNDDFFSQQIKQLVEQKNQKQRYQWFEKTLSEAEKRCDFLMSTSKEPIAYLHDGMHIKVNQAYIDFFCAETSEDIEGIPVLDLVASEDTSFFKQTIRDISKNKLPSSDVKVNLTNLNGEKIISNVKFSFASYEQEPCVQMIVGKEQQPEISKELLEELERFKERDLLTNWYKKELAFDILEKQKQTKKQISFWLCSVIDFNEYLKITGYQEEENIITKISQLFNTHFPESNVFRYSHHVIGGWINELDYDSAKEKIKNKFELLESEEVKIGNHILNFKFNVGGFYMEEPVGYRVSEIVEKSIQIIKEQEDNKKKKIKIFDPGYLDKKGDEDRLRKINEIKDAIDKGDFILHYQPIVPLMKTVEETGNNYSVRIRWKKETGEIILPGQFLPFVREFGFIKDIDLWMMTRSMAMLSTQQKNQKDFNFFLKIDCETLINEEDFLNEINKKIELFKIDRKNIIIELSVEQIEKTIDKIDNTIKSLNNFGFKIAISNIDTKKSSLSIIKSIKPNYIRINSLKLQSSKDEFNEIMEFKKNNNIEAIVDCVEDNKTLSFVYSNKIDFAEGYFLAEPGTDLNYEF